MQLRFVLLALAAAPLAIAGEYQTYEWAGRRSAHWVDQSLQRAIDEQLSARGLRRVDSGGELQVAYQASGPLVVDLFDPVKHQLAWQGAAEKTLALGGGAELGYLRVQKAVAKVFRNYGGKP